jgi:hypothetical protein
MGLCGPGGSPGVDTGAGASWAFGLVPVGKESFVFSEIIFQCKTNSGKTQKMFKGIKIPKKFHENSLR